MPLSVTAPFTNDFGAGLGVGVGTTPPPGVGAVGTGVGAVGTGVGAVGTGVGTAPPPCAPCVGVAVGFCVGFAVGFCVGFAVGFCVGGAVGDDADRAAVRAAVTQLHRSREPQNFCSVPS